MGAFPIPAARIGGDEFVLVIDLIQGYAIGYPSPTPLDGGLVAAVERIGDIDA